MVISHRGNDIYGYKENTKEAIISTLKSNYVDGVEFDIRMTKDDYLVLSHNFMSDNKIIKYTDYKDLKLIELKKLLKNIKTNKILLIEIKDNDNKIVDILYKIIKKFKKLNILIHTFNYNQALYFKEKYNEYKVGLIIGNIINQNKDITKFDFISQYYRVNKKYKKEVFYFTINDSKMIKKYYLKNKNIITDKPYLIQEL